MTVAICTLDRPRPLARALAALRCQTDPDFELVIVDNGPNRRTRDAVAAAWPDARYVAEPRRGIAHARNLALRLASGEIIAYTDDDCRPAQRWVESIRAIFLSDPTVGCVTGPIFPLEIRTEAQKLLELRGGFHRGPERAVFEPWLDGRGPVYPVQAWMFGAGGSMAFSTWSLRRIGGFDPALPCSEEIDAFYRIVRDGLRIVYEPAAAVGHDHPAELEQLRRRLVRWGWGYLTMLDKIARARDGEFSARARRERRNWLRFQLLERLPDALLGRSDFPAHMIVGEIVGGLAGYFAYPLARFRYCGTLRAASAVAALPGRAPNDQTSAPRSDGWTADSPRLTRRAG